MPGGQKWRSKEDDFTDLVKSNFDVDACMVLEHQAARLESNGLPRGPMFVHSSIIVFFRSAFSAKSDDVKL